MDEGETMPVKFDIDTNAFLAKKTIGYYNRFYTKLGNPDNPDFLNTLKNLIAQEEEQNLKKARRTVRDILVNDIPIITQENDLPNCICVCVPRAKALDTYLRSQLYFKEAVSNAIAVINEINGNTGIIDGTNYIKRTRNTRTTHLPRKTGRATNTGGERGNNGADPYPGITRETCKTDKTGIEGQNIILVDDIYTKTVNIDEDCIQALYDNGAKSVIFYAIGYSH